MLDQQINSRIIILNDTPLKQELVVFLDYLLSKQITEKKQPAQRKMKIGCARGKFRMADDFNAPLDDHFKDYMPS